MDGSEKLPLLIIGKTLKPRCFKSAKPPLAYTANRRAWMTSDIFEHWLKDWDRRLKSEGRKILLFIDNCPSHPTKVELNNIVLKFLPPNATSSLQPMDQGVIYNLKVIVA